ncbi:delta-like protein A [Pomacea canaliculata]|uniref:delta-like protein A n=1 Tax=Pomacea canaliculata TaxID=400727 RepID=UPI000D72BD60|nr:delta-like protein A [Pomacea canaliculata]
MNQIGRSQMLLVLVGSVLVTGVACNCVPRCQNGGQCRQNICICRPNFNGTHCQIDRRPTNPCYFERCKNGGTCMQLGLGYMCSCSEGYTGTNCENVGSWNTPPASTDTSDMYNPLGVLLGVVLSLVALAAVLGLLSWWRISRRQQQLRYSTRHELGNHVTSRIHRNSRLSSTSDNVVTSVSEVVERGSHYGPTYAPYDPTLFLPPAYSLAVNDPKYCGDDNLQGPPPSYEETMTLGSESVGGDEASSETRPPDPRPPEGRGDTAASADQTGEIIS